MNADAFRQLYEYHFAENRKTWNWYVTDLTQEQYTQEVPYSLGSVRNHLVHLASVDDSWFAELRGVDVPHGLNPVHFPKREKLRAHWDEVEQRMRDYLATLTDANLFDKSLPGEDKDLTVWQVLIHVVNHGTDHRAQVLRVIADLGIRTGPQDYVFYAYEHP